MKAIIFPPTPEGGEGVYVLIREDGVFLAEHFCSSAFYAPGDLYLHRPERQPFFEEKEITEFVWLKDSGISEDELLKRNKAWYELAEAVGVSKEKQT